MKIHELKVKQPFYDDLFFERKNFEVRKNDREYKVGDILHLKEYPTEDYPKRKGLLRKVIYILDGGQYGLDSEYVVMGLKKVEIQ